MHLECGQPQDPHAAGLIDKADLKGPLPAHIAHLNVHPRVLDGEVS